MVAGKTNLGVAIVEMVDPGFDADLFVEILGLQHVFQDVFHIFYNIFARILGADHKMVVGEAGDRSTFKGGDDALGQIAQQFVAELKSEALVVKFEIGDIKMDKRHILTPDLGRGEHHLHLVVKERHV